MQFLDFLEISLLIHQLLKPRHIRRRQILQSDVDTVFLYPPNRFF